MYGIFGPLLDRDLFDLDTVTKMTNRKSNFYPYDVIAILNADKTKVKTYVIQVALAGITKDEIKVELTEDNGIKVSVTPENHESEYAKVIRSQISYAKKSIIFELPKEVNLSKVNSKYVNGILEIYLPMSYAKSEGRSIKIG